MAYAKTNRLNMRRVPSGISEYVGVGLSGITDTVGSILHGGLNIYNAGQQAQGAVQAQNALLQADMARANSSDNTLLVVGGLGLAAGLYFLLRKK